MADKSAIAEKEGAKKRILRFLLVQRGKTQGGVAMR